MHWRSGVAIAVCAALPLTGCGGGTGSIQASVLGGPVAGAANDPRGDLARSLEETTRAAFERRQQIAALPDSVGLKTPVLLQGSLTGATGTPMSGAAVLVSAWPSNEAVRAMPIGSTFTTSPIARTVADARGGYTLRSDLTPVLAGLLGKDGLDIQLDVIHDGRQYTYLSQVLHDGVLGWLRPTVTDVLDLASLFVGKPGNAVNVAFRAGQGLELPDGAVEEKFGPEGPGSDPGPRPYLGGAPCLERKVAAKKVWTTVASAVARQGTTARVTYTYGAKSTLSAGMSYDGGVSFHASGERTRTSTLRAKFFDKTGTKGTPATFEYQVRMEQFVIGHECLGNKPDEFFIRGYRTSPGGPTGGFLPVPSRFPLSTCRRANTELAGGDEATTVPKEAFTYERGFGFNPVKGASFTGAATSGYSKAVKVKFLYAKPKNGPQKKNLWCGHTGFPTAQGQRVQGFQR